MFVMLKDSSSPYQCSRRQHSYILSSSPIAAASCLNFFSLALSVWLVSWYVLWKVNLREVWELYWSFSILINTSLISESLLGNTPVTMAILQKCLGTFSKSCTISLSLTFFLEFIFNFDFRIVSRNFTTYSCLHLSQKWLLMRFLLSVVLERTVRFLTTIVVVLEEYNNCQPNSKWLSVKHVSIVFG